MWVLVLVLVLYRGYVLHVCMDVTYYVLTSGGGAGKVEGGIFLEYDIFAYSTVPYRYCGKDVIDYYRISWREEAVSHTKDGMAGEANVAY